MAIKISNKTRSEIVDYLVGTYFVNGELLVYTGSEPETADDPATGALLVTIVAGWGDATNGTAVLNGSLTGEAVESGTAGYARFKSGYGTSVFLQGNVGTAATCDFILDKEVFSTSETIGFTGGNIVYPQE